MTESRIILTASDIHREFETVDNHLHVLRGLNLTLEKKQIAAVVGASGVGKSTLLHILGGLDKPTKGEVTINGQTLNKKNETQLANFRNDHIGFVFQQHYLMEDFTALENVMIPVMITGKSKKAASEKAELLLGKVGLKDRRSHRPAQLSGGEQQRVAVARALANDPLLLLADEPSGNLDSKTGRKLHELLLGLKEESDIAMLIATHNIELSRECEKNFVMKDGQVIEEQI